MMLLALLIGGGGALLLSRMTGKPLPAIVILLVLAGLGWVVFQKVQSGVMGGVSKSIGV